MMQATKARQGMIVALGGESHSRHGEEVERDDSRAMIAKKRKPFLARVTLASKASQVARDHPFGDYQAELLQVTVDLLCAPIGVSCARRRIRTRISLLILGRPPRRRDRHRLYRRKPARCQPTTVSGCTIRSTSLQGAQRGLGRFRLSSANCWRRGQDFERHVGAPAEEGAKGGKHFHDD